MVYFSSFYESELICFESLVYFLETVLNVSIKMHDTPDENENKLNDLRKKKNSKCFHQGRIISKLT